METTTRTIEIELEELDEGTWRAALAGPPTDTDGTGRFRLTARMSGDPATPRFVGSPFRMPRSSIARLADDVETDVEARVRLGEMDTALTTAGWRNVTDRGAHWWSLRYTKA